MNKHIPFTFTQYKQAFQAVGISSLLFSILFMLFILSVPNGRYSSSTEAICLSSKGFLISIVFGLVSAPIFVFLSVVLLLIIFLIQPRNRISLFTSIVQTFVLSLTFIIFVFIAATIGLSLLDYFCV